MKARPPYVLTQVLVLLLSVSLVFAQETVSMPQQDAPTQSRTFTQQEVDQMVAPIAAGGGTRPSAGDRGRSPPTPQSPPPGPAGPSSTTPGGASGGGKNYSPPLTTPRGWSGGGGGGRRPRRSIGRRGPATSWAPD